ncbi:hypothetical protein [Lichenicola sp.]|uniref:hypothetical protein n=1 Tax=Lichenicola sp. TaxID=2804529 RepID=UPI003AFFBC31
MRAACARALSLVLASLLAACSFVSDRQAGPVKLAGESDTACIHRLYDYPIRSEPFATAAHECAGTRTVDLTGDPYYQELTTTQNIAFVNRTPNRNSSITLTGSRIPQSTTQVAPPELSLH